jgi:predicted DNA-binding protein
MPGLIASPQLGGAVGKKTADGGGRPPIGKQINVRVPPDLSERLDRVSVALALDVSAFIRMVLAENLAVYERRAEQIERDRKGGDS